MVRLLGDLVASPGARGTAGRANRFRLVSHSGVPVGHLLFSGKGREADVMEAVGDRSLLLVALRQLAGERGTPLGVRVPRGDLLAELLTATGVQAKAVASEGTIKVVSFSATMPKLLPYFRERLPGWGSLSLEAAEDEGRYLAWNEAGSLQIEGESNMLWALLGRPEGAPREGITATGAFEELLERCLPLPMPSVYLNMI